MSEMDLKSAPRVPETVLKRKRAASFAAALNSKRKRSNKTKSKLETSVKRAEKFVMEFRNKERSTRRAKSVIRGKRADSSKRITIAPEDKVLLVIRIRAGKKDEIPNIYAKTLKKFSLNKLFSGRLIRHNKDNLKKLKTIEEYVTWGSPNLKLIQDLVHKRGYTRVDKVKRPLSDNTVIEEKLGDCGIICVSLIFLTSPSKPVEANVSHTELQWTKLFRLATLRCSPSFTSAGGDFCGDCDLERTIHF
uniref:Ribosomal protein L30 ferredoxin-like fold domain-containing protein n=1 Tax=Rhodosorus marinus TaxID=101924 RepID=A0A7S2ZNJ8_9RHOD|mmetsp:Transcript_25163/g.99230  ORF Transcript_25163/g.99230 Transcript_25163/m.99230 type:complete len:248 (+) Transcript_25163:332-1075(+)